MSKPAQLLVHLPSPTVADKTVLRLFFSRGQFASNNGDQTQNLPLQSLLFFFFLFYLDLSCFLCERMARFQKWNSLTASTSAGLFYPYSHCHLVSRCLNWQRVLGRKFSQLLIDALLWHVQLIHSESGLQPALKSWNSCRVEECWWQYAGVGNTLGIHSPLGLCAQRNLCILKFILSQVTYPTACTLQKG